MLYLASDHAGFALKEAVKKYLLAKNEAVEDLGTHSTESTDYTIYAHKLGEKISQEQHSRGIAVCGTGLGISMALNRHTGVRAARSMSIEDAELTRRHNDANVLVLSGRQTDSETAKQIVEKFLTTAFEDERHAARVKNIDLK